MKKIKFLFQRILKMDYGNFFKTVKTVHQRTGKNSILVFLDIVYCGFKYRAGHLDYLEFEFYNLNKEQRASYVTRGVSLDYVTKLNDFESRSLINDKATFLGMFSDVGGRNWLDIEKSSFEDFKEFFKQNQKIIAKVKNSVGGKGIEFYDYDGSNEKEVYENLIDKGQLLVEEVVVQHPELAKIHPKSVNTLRIMTIQIGGKVEIPFVALRTGNGKAVDNLNSGGYSARVNVETGIVQSNGSAKFSNVVEKHPMTGIQYKGLQIPLFEEAKALVIEQALKLPKLGFIAWDIAILEDNRIIVIEANDFPGHDVYQLPEILGEDRMGMKPVFDEIIERLRKEASINEKN